jgi:hypothetical protein
MREHDGVDRPGAVGEIRDVGQEEVDTHVLVAREGEPGVDDETAASALDDGHVLPHLAEAAERDDADRLAHGCSVYGAEAQAGSSG